MMIVISHCRFSESSFDEESGLCFLGKYTYPMWHCLSFEFFCILLGSVYACLLFWNCRLLFSKHAKGIKARHSKQVWCQ